MKKITVKSDTRTEEYVVFDGMNIHNGSLFYHCTDGTDGAISLCAGRRIIIEDHEEERDWFLVAGVCSEEIYAESKHMYDEESQIKLKEHLTQKEAEELETIIREKMNNY